MRILLTGMTGQVGGELRSLLAPLGTLVATDRHSLDLTLGEGLAAKVRSLQPDLIVNAAAYTAVDRAETELQQATQINAIAPTQLAIAAEALGIPLIHLSTDYVFDGQKNTPYLETDPTHPLSAYGQSKWQGEAGIRQHCTRHIILRTAWVYGVYGQGNFVKTMLRLGAEREELRVVVDQVGAPTWARSLAEVVTQFAGRSLTSSVSQPELDSFWGTYHFTNNGAVSWYDFAVAIFEEAATLGFPLRVQRVLPITSAEYPTPAARPAYSVLSDRKTRAVLDLPPCHWRTALRQMLRQWLAHSAPTVPTPVSSFTR